MKTIDILRTASGNMRRSKLRTLLTIIAIFIGALTLTLTNGIGSGVQSYIDDQVGNIGAEDVLVIQAKSESSFGTSGPKKYVEGSNVTTAGGFPVSLLSTADLEKIRAQEGIKSAEFDLSAVPNFISGKNGEKYQIMTSVFYEGINIDLQAGGLPSNAVSDGQILLPPGYVGALGYDSADQAVGQVVTLGIMTPAGEMREVQAKVIGIQEESLISAGGAMVNRFLAQQLFDIQTEGLPENAKTQLPFIAARFDASMSEEDLASLKQQLDEKGYSAKTIQDQIGLFKQAIDAVIMVLNFFAGIALLAASFGIVNTLLMSVQERTKEIGLMKAMGMGRRKVFMLFSIEAILIGFWGSLLGSLAGIGLGSLANKLSANTFLKDLVGFNLTSFSVSSVLSIMFIVMMIAFLAGTLPAWRASKKNPIEALRTE